ncbi:MAG: dihydropteroate synthase [Actinomycetota bacterium]|nr:dihydropteroate synthase [Actinomycetota bacterium]
MGIVNVTPDSFSDGGSYLDPGAAIAHGLGLAAAGAAVIDVGGESTRPGAEPVDAGEELRRVLAVVRAIADQTPVPLSIDTTKAVVARAALDAGAVMVNDVSGGTADPDMLAVVAQTGAAYVAMHTRGTPRTMQSEARYSAVVREVGDELRTRVERAFDAGVDPRALLADPGIGFAKTGEHNLALLRALPELAARVGVPLMVGTSRKSFLARLLPDAADLDDDRRGRDDATLATTVWCFERGAALVRVHDVAGSRRAVDLLDALDRATPEGMAA